MKDQYAALAGSYGQTEETAIHKYVVAPTFLRELGPVDGARVLDLACGTGIFTRLLLSSGAHQVVGVDVSVPMIEAARGQQKAGDPRIEYRVDDVATMAPLGEFDVVTAVFLLNYAPDRRRLDAMCRTVAAHLRPGGRFAAVVPNPDFDFHSPDAGDSRSGRTTEFRETDGDRRAPQDGDILTLTLHLATQATIQNYYWSAQTYRQALQAARFKDVTFTPVQPSPEGIDLLGNDFWQPLMDNPPIVITTASR
ncbi:class I SAM-dependent methyltransferase [Streptomyces goshikiensis]|uniref:class I SAM-dependent methyltransferase n=1 Tax=Streptomyces goshikiensis TaxID=1942 RepID=UPI0036BECF37